MQCEACGSGDLDWSMDGAHARCRRCPSLYTRDGAGFRRVVVEAPGGGYNPEFQAMFEAQLGFGPRPGGAMGGGGPAAPPGNPLGRTIQLMIVGLVGFIFVAVGADVAYVLYASLPH